MVMKGTYRVRRAKVLFSPGNNQDCHWNLQSSVRSLLLRIYMTPPRTSGFTLRAWRAYRVCPNRAAVSSTSPSPSPA